MEKNVSPATGTVTRGESGQTVPRRVRWGPPDWPPPGTPRCGHPVAVPESVTNLPLKVGNRPLDPFRARVRAGHTRAPHRGTTVPAAHGFTCGTVMEGARTVVVPAGRAEEVGNQSITVRFGAVRFGSVRFGEVLFAHHRSVLPG